MNFGIIAAGEGSRLLEEGVDYPKPLVPLCGEPMIGRLIRIFEQNGAERISVIVNEHMTVVREYIGKLDAMSNAEIVMVVKSTPSSMHSFYEISKSLRGRGRFIVTTVDTIFREEDFSAYVSGYAALPEEVDGLMALTRYIDDEKPLYVDTDAGMKITAFLDKPDDSWARGCRFISGGIYGLSDSSVDVLEKSIGDGKSRMRNFQRALVEAGLDIRGFDMGKIIDVDHAGDIRKAEVFING